jgi:nicotinamide mononucleotide transporter
MLAVAFTAWGAAVTWLEIVAFVLALVCVAGNVGQRMWAWPVAIVGCVLYGWLFAAHRIYAEAVLQGVFVVSSLWGWWQWRHGRRGSQPAGVRLTIARLSARQALAVVLAWGVLWLLIGAVLSRYTDSDVAWLDALPAAGSLIGQVLLARKILENWWVWIAVNLASIVLFAHKQLWLSALLYAIFLGMAALGLARWRATWRAAGGSRPPSSPV